jgi:hypothetical protein
LRDLLQQRRDKPPSPADKVAEIMEAKKKYGSLNHGQKKLGGQLINDLFEDTAAFMSALVSSGHVVPGHPEQSSFFEFTSFDGPMYRVFTDEELKTWSDWVFWLSSKQQNQPIEMDPAKLMAACIDHFREEQRGTPMHMLTNLTGPDPGHPGQTLTQPVSAWMDEPAAAIMAALADGQNNLIVSGNSAGSSFLTKIVGADNSMGREFTSVAPNTNGKTWTRVVADWIDAGCPLPITTAQAHLAIAGTGPAVRLTITAPSAEIDRHPRGRIQGMGVVH